MDLKYSNISKEQSISDLQTIIQNQSNDKFKSYYNSKYGDYILDVFASFTDNANYNINRRFEESFNETAKLDESQIMLSHDKGYDIQRSIPSKSQITPSPNNISNFNDVNRIILEKGTSFSVDEMYYTLTQDIDINIVGGSFTMTTENYNTLEGVFKTSIIDKEDFNAFLFSSFGSEKTSNMFGSVVGLSDEVYDFCNMSVGEVDEFGNDVVIYTSEISDGNGGFTTQNVYNYIIERVMNYNVYDIMLGYNNIDPNNEFKNSYELSIHLNKLEADSNKVLPLCYVRTSRNKLPEILFTDGRVTRFPRNNIKIKHFTSNGSLGNKNILNKTATLFKRNATVFINGDLNGIHRDENTPNNTVDEILNNLVFTFTKNSISGIDMESAYEISTNMDSFYSMQDRLVTDKDYNTFFSRGLFKDKLFSFWGETKERNYFQDISPYNNNTVFINYKGINEDIFNNLDNGNSVDIAGLFFNNIDGFASKYYIDDSSVNIPTDIQVEKRINLSSYKDYLYMYYLREIIPLKLLSNVKNDNITTSNLDNAPMLADMISIVTNTGSLGLNYAYVPSIEYSNIVYTLDVTIAGAEGAIEGVNTDKYTTSTQIRNTIRNVTNATRGLETSKLINQLTTEYNFISNIETKVSINDNETTVSQILTDGNIFEDMFITSICSYNKSLYDLFIQNNYFKNFPTLQYILSFNTEKIRLVEGFKNSITARKLASIYRELFRFMFVMQINGYLNDLSVDDVYSRVNNFYEFVESKMKYDVIKNLSKSKNSLDYTEFTLPTEFINVEDSIEVNVVYKNLSR